MILNSNYVLLEKIEEEKVEGYQEVQVQDSFVYKGKVKRTPSCPVYVDSHALEVGDVVIFTPHSPDTHTVLNDKYVLSKDILAVCQ